MTTNPARSTPDRTTQHRPAACFSVHAAADPGLMPRILEIFAKRGIVPSRWHSSIGGPDDRLTIDLEMNGLSVDGMHAIAGEMRAVWGVALVLSSQKIPV